MMKIYKNILGLITCMTVFLLMSSTHIIAQVNTFPYFYDFENEGQGSTGCNPTHNMIEPGWVNATNDNMDWTSDANGTSSSSTGPSTDHTPNGQYYMYLETSCSAIRTANLETPTFDFSSAPAPQLSFWYHMYGATIGTMYFEASTNNGVSWTTLWQLTGAQQSSSADAWLQATIGLAAYGGNANVKFRFRGVSGTSFTGDMAIDDFLVENLLPDNAGISAMLSPLPGSAAGTYPVDVELTNYGSNNLNSVNIEWEINGVPQAPVAYSGPAVVPFTNTNVNLTASQVFASGLTTLKFWTSMPNGVMDNDVNNDTLQTIFCTGLSGSYTVGGASSNFPTIQAAVDAITNCGMAGPVTMNVQSGTYNETLSLSAPISGLSAANTLTWDGGNQAATLSSNSSITVLLDGVDYVTIRGFTINNLNTSTAFGVLLTNQANYNTIDNNTITIASTSSNTACIASSNSTTSTTSSGNNANYTTISNNTISGSYRGISLRGTTPASNYTSGNSIVNNEIFNIRYYGIYAYYQDSLLVQGNYIHDLVNTTHYGSYTYYSMNSQFLGNDIQVDDYGMYFGRTNSETVPARDALIANNMVISAVDRAIYAYYSRSTNYYHNSLKAANVALVLSNFDGTVEVMNNIMYSENDFAFESFTASALGAMDYNLFFTPSSNPNFIAYSGGYSDLPDWQNNGPFTFDANSLEGMPQFVSATDLHLDGAFNNDMGIYVGVDTDFDGDSRPAAGASAVDIGADEFTPPYNDAGISDLASPTIPINPGFSNVEVAVRNFGIDPISSVDVEWEIDGVGQAPFSYAGNIMPNDFVLVNLANINFAATTTQLKFWTSQPNGVVDERQENDTLLIDICPGLSGTYTVGSPNADYATMEDALEALQNCGVSGPTEFQIQVGTYGPVRFEEVPGASMVNTVTFNGLDASDVLFTHDGSGTNSSATVVFDGADYITLKNVTIETTGPTSSHGVLLTKQADYNTIMDNVINLTYSSGIINVVGILASNSYSQSSGAASEGNNANYNLIQGNLITGGSSSIVLEGGVSNSENYGNQIINNELTAADDYGIYMDEQDSLAINGNKIYGLQSSFSDAVVCFDIHVFEMIGNEITSNDYGIFVDGGFNPDLSRDGLIANNMIECQGTSAEALFLRDVENIRVYHNNLVGSPAILIDNHSLIDVRNNILSTLNDYCFESFDPVAMADLDYNIYYISGAFGDAVRFGTTIYTTLADWQTTGPGGYDQNSISGNPVFINGLHVSSSITEDIATTNITDSIAFDFDGDVRPYGAGNDIGADEKIAAANDAIAIGLVSPVSCGDTASVVTVAIGNLGATVLINVPITVNVSGDINTTLTSVQPIIAPGANYQFNIGTLNIAAGGNFDFEIIISAGADSNPLNDTFRISITIPPNNQFALSSTGDQFVCEGTDANLQVTSVVNNIAILWYDDQTAGSLVHIGEDYTLNGLMNDTTLYVQLQGCNSGRVPVSVLVDTVGIAVDLGPDQTVCGATGAELIPSVSLSPADNYLWSNGSQTSMLEVFSSGQYVVTVYSASGCFDMDTIDVTAVPAPTITSSALDVTCGGYADGSIDMTVSGTVGPYNYAWSTGQTTEDLSGLSQGIFVVTITDNGGIIPCTYIEVVEINEPSAVTANIDGTTTSCNTNDGTIQLSAYGGTPGYSYLWSNGATDEDLTGLASGSYDVTVTDQNGCEGVATATVQGSNPINVSIDTIFHEYQDVGGSIQITVTGGSGAGFAYAWSHGATTANVDSLVAGTYSVTVLDLGTGCEVLITNIVVLYKIPDLVDQIEVLTSFDLFPNPTYDMTNIELSLDLATDVTLQIMSIEGKLLDQFTTNNAIEQQYQIDLSAYPAGVYLAKLQVGSELITTKIIKL